MQSTNYNRNAKMIRDVHTSHCCLRHGCVYRSLHQKNDCTVLMRRGEQEQPCEECYNEKEEEKAHNSRPLKREIGVLTTTESQAARYLVKILHGLEFQARIKQTKNKLPVFTVVVSGEDAFQAGVPTKIFANDMQSFCDRLAIVFAIMPKYAKDQL